MRACASERARVCVCLSVLLTLFSFIFLITLIVHKEMYDSTRCIFCISDRLRLPGFILMFFCVFLGHF